MRAAIRQMANAAIHALSARPEVDLRAALPKVFDGYRPLSVQQKMWDAVPDERYVSNPATNSGRHTRGTAVDLTLVDRAGNELAMPTGFDDFTEKAHSDYRGPGVSAEQIRNRTLLAEVMTRHGFQSYAYEWWHFDLAGWERYSPLDLPFEALPAVRTAPRSQQGPAATRRTPD